MTEKIESGDKDGMRRILLCLAGGTPQIITESIYAITQIYGKRLDEVHVVTTPTGREKILENLLHKKSGKFYRFCDDYGIDPSTIIFNDRTITLVGSDRGRILADLVTEDENQAAIDHICRIVRELASKSENIIHASVAGGRKTMGIALTMAMQLFGRAQDHLFHVLVNPDYESHGEFYYPRPKGQTLHFEKGANKGKPIESQPWVSAAEIEFLRLGGVLSEWLNEEEVSYKRLVQQAQEELDIKGRKLRIHLGEDRISVANRSIDLQDGEFFVYVLLAMHCRRSNGESFLKLRELSNEKLEEVFSLIAPHRNPDSYQKKGSATLKYLDSYPGYNLLKTALSYLKHGNLTNLDSQFGRVKSRANNKMKDSGIPEQFMIQKKYSQGRAEYGLSIKPGDFEFI